MGCHTMSMKMTTDVSVILRQLKNVTPKISAYMVMHKMYPLDRRKVAIHIYSIVTSLRKTALLLNISHSSVARWLKQSHNKSYSRCSLKTDHITELIRTTVEQNPFSSLTSLRELIKTVLNIEVSEELIRIVKTL